MRMLKPVHPGIFIKSEIIEAYGLTITAAAKLLQVSRPTRVHAAEWTRVTFGRDGNATGTGIRRQYGDVDANAVGVGYCADKTARR